MANLSRSEQQQHVVAVPLPAQGHINPLMRFCKVLASQHGFLVTFVNIDPVHHRVEDLAKLQQVEAAAEEEGHAEQGSTSGHNIRKAHIPIQGLQDLDSDFRISFEPFFEALISGMAPPLELLIRTLNQTGPPVTCILSDISLSLPTQDVADKLNLARIAFVPCSPSFILLIYHVIQGEHISTIKVLEALTTRVERREVVADGLAGLPTIYNDELPWYKHVIDDSLYLWELSKKVCESSFHYARAMVFNSFEDLDTLALMTLSKCLSLPVYGVGPLVEPLHKESSTSLWKEDETCIRWLDQQPPLSVLYISFGSISLLSQAQIEELIEGLLSSQQRFLWVFRPDLAQNVEFSTSTSVFDVLSRSHGKGYIVDWAPQLRVLSHPSIGGFLTHCGWNSTMEAIAHGVPMLCWPYFADQFLDAKYVVEVWKVGLHFKVSHNEGVDSLVERGEIERVIKALMEGEEGRALRKNAVWLKEAGCESLLPGGTSHNNMQALLRSFYM